MALKKFNPSKISKNNNPFPNSRAVAIVNGIYIKELLGSYELVPETRTAIKIGLLHRLYNHYEKNKDDNGRYKPSHLLILADYGQGKTLSLRYMQEEIFSKTYDVLISYSIGNNAISILEEQNKFIKNVLKDLHNTLTKLAENKYPDIKTDLDNIPDDENLLTLLQLYDNIFNKINTQVYIIVDELDKILTASDATVMQKSFLEEIKMIADSCSKAISLWMAGTPNCEIIINSLGRDYIQRFLPPIKSTFNMNETIEYIDKKCTQILTYKGYIPYTNEVKKEIFKYSNGNIRNIDYICKELWDACSEKNARIDKKEWKKYISEKLNEPIKEIFGIEITNNQLNVITLLIVNDRVSLTTLNKGKTNRAKQEILSLLENNDSFKRINRSYRLDNDVKNELKKKILGG